VQQYKITRVKNSMSSCLAVLRQMYVAHGGHRGNVERLISLELMVYDSWTIIKDVVTRLIQSHPPRRICNSVIVVVVVVVVILFFKWNSLANATSQIKVSVHNVQCSNYVGEHSSSAPKVGGAVAEPAPSVPRPLNQTASKHKPRLIIFTT